MHKKVVIRDRQQGKASDINNLESFTQQTFDNLIKDTVTAGYGYAGFVVSQRSATQINIDPGRLYAGGIMYTSLNTKVIDFIDTLPLGTRKKVAIIATGSEVDDDSEPRSFIVDVETRTTETQVVATTRHRQAVVERLAGLESADPQNPVLSANQTLVAVVTLGTSGIIGIDMYQPTRVPNNSEIAARATELESWRLEAGNRLETLGTDISNLAIKIEGGVQPLQIRQLMEDMALVRYRLEINTTSTSYGMDVFLDERYSNKLAAGYNCKIDEGLRFGDAALAETLLALSNPADPQMSIHSSGLVLPKYTETSRIAVTGFSEAYGLSQYAYQTVAWKLKKMSTSRLRFGQAFTYCFNTVYYNPSTGVSGRLKLDYDYKKGVFTDPLTGRTYQALDTNFDPLAISPTENANSKEKFIRLQEFWYDEEVEYYQDRVVTDYSVSGSVTAQTFLNTQGGWLTSIDLAFTQKAATGVVSILLCECREGKPDREKAIATVNVDPADIVVGTTFTTAAQWTRVRFKPTALEAGKMYGIVIVTGANHFVGLAQGSKYASGTLFYSTDGQFFMGDLTKDLMFKANFAEFQQPRIELGLGSISLAGGIGHIDILTEAIRPSGSQLTYEVRPDGQATWFSLADISVNPFQTLPLLCHLRAVLVGTKDMMPGLNMQGSRVRVARPAGSVQHNSSNFALTAPTQVISVDVTLDWFKEAVHDHLLQIRDVTNNATKSPGSFTDETVGDYGDGYKRIIRHYKFTATQFTIATSLINFITTMAAPAMDSFHVEKVVWNAA
jgi:hypothetical protein